MFPTLGNRLEADIEKLEPVGKVIDESSDKTIDTINSMSEAQLNVFFNRVLLGFSCLAFLLSVVYRFALKKVAMERAKTAELNSLIWDASICILLTLFDHSVCHWWTIPAVPIFSFDIAYPLLYIPKYKHFRWMFAMVYDFMTVTLGFLFFFGIMYGEGGLLAKVLGLVAAVLAFLYYVTHRKFHYCPNCKKYVNIRTDVCYDNTTEQVVGSRMVDVATEYRDTYRVDSSGNKTCVSSVAIAWDKVKKNVVSVRREYFYSYSCPYCGHKWTEHGVETDEVLE